MISGETESIVTKNGKSEQSIDYVVHVCSNCSDDSNALQEDANDGSELEYPASGSNNV